MKTRIIIAMLMLYSTGVFAQQTNGAINGKTENGIRKEVSVDSFTANRFAFMVLDSISNVYGLATKLKTDSIYTRLGTGIPVTGTFWQATQPVSGTVAATQSGTWNITNVSGTVSLPTGAATSNNQSTEITSLQLLDDAVNTDASAVSGRGLLVMGSDGTNARNIKTNTAGNLETKMLAVDSTNLAGINNKLAGTLTVGSHAVTNAGTFAVQVDSSTQRTTVKMDSTLQRKGVVIIGGSITATAGATAIFDSTYAAVTMDTAGLGAKANSATVGWQSDSVGLRQHKVTDVKIGISLDMASGAPANDKAVYVYVYPLWYDGSAMNFTDGGTGTLPSGANSTYTIATPNDLTLLGVLSYTTSDQIVSRQFMLSSVFPTMPDGFGIIIVNYSGVALAASTHKVVYSLVTKVQR